MYIFLWQERREQSPNSSDRFQEGETRLGEPVEQINPSLAAYYPLQLLHCNTFSGRFLPTSCREQLNNDSFIHSLLLLSPELKEYPRRGDNLLRRAYSVITVMRKRETPFLYGIRNFSNQIEIQISVLWKQSSIPCIVLRNQNSGKFITIFPFSLPFFRRVTNFFLGSFALNVRWSPDRCNKLGWHS